ncbi:MAG: DNA primase [Desulfobacteraceae bacterium]|nr:MAG: DNA primase [Desulfobacteraceae bacterium]
MRIPEDKVSEILHISDIVQVISESVILKKSGINYFGLCPFHTEKTPSFSVNAQKQIFHCFGCSAGGNVYSFLMKYHGITFPEAVRMLARKYNVTIETQALNPAQQRELNLKEQLFKLNRHVLNFYSGILGKDRGAGQARQYLQQRGTSHEVLSEFGLGFAPDQWDSVERLLRQLKISPQLALSSGLVLPRKQKSGFYDRFRNRVIFPIFDINMQVAGFGGRVMDDSMPKYLNSPETPVYNKGRILYGLHAAKSHCRHADRVYIVEGYFDFLTLYQHGVKNTVASLGTALTSDHVRILKGFASKMVLVFDSDTAGINAAKRSIGTFVKQGVEVSILVLPDGNDPDSFVAQKGKGAFEALAENALNSIEFLVQVAVDKYGLTVEGRVAILNEMKTHLAQVEDSAVRSLYIRELSERINIDEKAVLEKVRETLTRQTTGDLTTELIPDKDMPASSHPREEQIISLMLQYPEIHPEIETTKVLSYFYSKKLKEIGNRILSIAKDNTPVVSQIISTLPQEEQHLITALAIQEIDLDNNLEHKAKDLISRIIRIRKKEENTLTNKIISAEKGGDAELFELLAAKQKEIQQLQ